jgi:hypothetical protein
MKFTGVIPCVSADLKQAFIVGWEPLGWPFYALEGISSRSTNNFFPKMSNLPRETMPSMLRGLAYRDQEGPRDMSSCAQYANQLNSWQINC